MTGSVTVAAPAKINLQLSVGPLRADGYHSLATVYQAVSLFDEVTVTPAPHTSLHVSGEGVDAVDVPADGRNLALRAAALLAEHGGLRGEDAHVAMVIRKRIPVAGGMAGGSADAAAALVACDALWQLHTPREQLLELAARLGSDVPFSLLGGTALGSGRGELVKPVPDTGTYHWVVVPSGEGLSTPAVFARLDRLRSGDDVPDPEVSAELLAALGAGDRRKVAAVLHNDLTPAALALRPDLAEVLALGDAAPAVGSLLSGSGPTCLLLADHEAAARELQQRLATLGKGSFVARGPAPGARVVG